MSFNVIVRKKYILVFVYTIICDILKCNEYIWFREPLKPREREKERERERERERENMKFPADSFIMDRLRMSEVKMISECHQRKLHKNVESCFQSNRETAPWWQVRCKRQCKLNVSHLFYERFGTPRVTEGPWKRLSKATHQNDS